VSEAIQPSRSRSPTRALADLRERLARTRFPDQIEGANWDYGTELSYLRELVAYWREKFDWRAQERLLNSFPHFKTRSTTTASISSTFVRNTRMRSRSS